MKKQDFIGKSILVGLSWVDYEDNLLAQQSVFGRITRIADNMLYIDSGEDEEFTIPFDAEHIEKSDPELIYNLHDPERTVSGVRIFIEMRKCPNASSGVIVNAKTSSN